MFERFPTTFHTTPQHGPRDSGTPPPGIRGLLGGRAGTTFTQGLYRLHTESSAAAADALVLGAYPDFAGRIACFGMDWLGRQFSLDPLNGPDEDPGVLLFDIGAGEALEIPTPFSRFHDEELVDYADAALAADFFDQWIKDNPSPILFDQCAGYRVALFLGGTDELSNLEATDLDVYWTLTGQLRVAALR